MRDLSFTATMSDVSSENVMLSKRIRQSPDFYWVETSKMVKTETANNKTKKQKNSPLSQTFSHTQAGSP